MEKHGQVVTGERVFGHRIAQLREIVEQLAEAVKALDEGRKVSFYPTDTDLPALIVIQSRAGSLRSYAEAIEQGVAWLKAGVEQQYLDRSITEGKRRATVTQV